MLPFRSLPALTTGALLAALGLCSALPAQAQFLSIQNAGFESFGNVQFAPNIYTLTGWTFFGNHPATAGGIKPGSNFGYNDSTAVLYLATDWVGFSNTGGVYQDIGKTVSGATYTFSGAVYGESINPSSYKISLRDALTGQQVAAITQADFNPPKFGAKAVTFSYTETLARTLRLQFETTGTVTPGTGFRTAIDNVSVRQQLPTVPEPGVFLWLCGGMGSGVVWRRCRRRARR